MIILICSYLCLRKKYMKDPFCNSTAVKKNPKHLKIQSLSGDILSVSLEESKTVEVRFRAGV
jgi:hypothetical protein